MTEAIYDAGYAAPSRFYADAKERLGMTPSAWRDGGRGETIRYVMPTARSGRCWWRRPQGHLPADLRRGRAARFSRRFPNADIRADDGTMRAGSRAR